LQLAQKKAKIFDNFRFFYYNLVMKTHDLTRSQQKVLNYIEHFGANEGRSPTLKEVGRGVGCSAVSTIHKHVMHLIEKGYLERQHGRGNNLVCKQVLVAEANAPSDENEATIKAFPYYGDVAAGIPISPDSHSVPVELPNVIHRNKEDLFVLRVKGDSMIDDSILDGDMVVLQRRFEYRNGDRVVVLIDREEVTLKEFRQDSKGVWLIPHNPDMSPRCYDANRIDVQGVLVGVMRSC
jgi:SOS regulatory protein LexA